MEAARSDLDVSLESRGQGVEHLALMGRVFVEQVDRLAHEVGTVEMRQLLAQVGLGGLKHFDLRPVHEADVVIGVGQHDVGAHGVERRRFHVGRPAQFLGVNGALPESLERLGHDADLVLASAVGNVDVELAGGHRRHGGVEPAHPPAEALRGPERDADDEEHDRSAGGAGGLERAIVLGGDIVVIDAGADHPAPGLEHRHIGGLLHRILGAGLRPHVIDKARARGLGDIGKGDEQGEAVRVLDTRQILAVEIGPNGMHHHGRMQIVDPEIIVALVAHLADGLRRGGLRFRFGDMAAFGFGIAGLDHAHGGLDEPLELLLPPRLERVEFKADKEPADGNQSGDKNKDDAVEPRAYAECHGFQLAKKNALRRPADAGSNATSLGVEPLKMRGGIKPVPPPPNLDQQNCSRPRRSGGPAASRQAAAIFRAPLNSFPSSRTGTGWL